MKSVSIIVPVHNEAPVIEKQINKINDYMELLGAEYEILICDNASTDDTWMKGSQLAKRLPNVKYYRTTTRGLGVGLRCGLNKATMEKVCFCPITICFGLAVIKRSLIASVQRDLVLDSKSHFASTINRTRWRKFFSVGHHILLKLFLKIKVLDTQGSFVCDRKKMLKFIHHLNSNSAFISAQIVLYADKYGLSIIELPVYYPKEMRPSKTNPIRVAFRITYEIIKEWWELLDEGD